jgi:hypothetical protein
VHGRLLPGLDADERCSYAKEYDDNPDRLYREYADASHFEHWRDGHSVARITWADPDGAEHRCAVTDQRWALEQLEAITRQPGYRLVSCVVE